MQANKHKFEHILYTYVSTSFACSSSSSTISAQLFDIFLCMDTEFWSSISRIFFLYSTRLSDLGVLAYLLSFLIVHSDEERAPFFGDV